MFGTAAKPSAGLCPVDLADVALLNVCGGVMDRPVISEVGSSGDPGLP